MTLEELATEYSRREESAGGLANCDPKAVVEQMASDLEVDVADLTDKLIDWWVLAA